MGVLCELPRHIVVDDGFDTFDIETARCEIGSEQVINLASFKVVQRSETLRVS